MSTEDLQRRANEWWAKMDERDRENATGPFLTPPARLHQNVGEYGQVPTNRNPVNPPHYASLDPQPWDVILAWNLGYLDGSVIKYVSRWRNKNGVEDLKKARAFLDKLIEQES